MGLPPKKQQYEILKADFSTLITIPYVFSFDETKTEYQWNLTIPKENTRTEKHADCIAFRALLQLHGKNSWMRSGHQREENAKCIRNSFLLLSFPGISDTGKQFYLYEKPKQYPRGVPLKKLQKHILVNGLSVDYGNGDIRKFVPFAASPSMSRQGQYLFVAEESEEELSRIVTLGLQEKGDLPWTKCVKDGVLMAKWNAYKGLCLTDGWAMDDLSVCCGKTAPFTVNTESTVIIKDITKTVPLPGCGLITYDTETDQESGIVSLSEQKKVQNADPVKVNDGEGLIDPETAKWISLALTGGRDNSITSFQIRLPFVKGMLHAVDFRAYVREHGIGTITDIDGNEHDIDHVHVILTESMVKAYKWFRYLSKEKNGTESHASEMFLSEVEKNRHTLFITMKGHSAKREEDKLNLNYQILQTSGLTEEQLKELFRKQMALYCGIGNDKEIRKQYFLSAQSEEPGEDSDTVLPSDTVEPDSEVHAEEITTAEEVGEWQDQPALENAAKQNNDLLFCSPVLQKRAEEERKRILEETLQGKMTVHGTSLFLSCDLMELLQHLLPKDLRKPEPGEEQIPSGMFYAPGWKSKSKYCALYRNPHYSRNEHLVLEPLTAETGSRREKYLGKLCSVVMLPAEGFGAARLGGADFDGDHAGITDDNVYVDHLETALGLKALTDAERRVGFGSALPAVLIPDAGRPGKGAFYTSSGNPEKCRLMAAEAFLRACSGSIGLLSYAAFEAVGRAYYQGLPDTPEKYTVYAGLEIDAAKKGWTMQTPEKPEKGSFLAVSAALKKGTRTGGYTPESLKEICEKILNMDTVLIRSPFDRLPAMFSEFFDAKSQEIQMRKAWGIRYSDCFSADDLTISEKQAAEIKNIATAFQQSPKPVMLRSANPSSGNLFKTLNWILLRHSHSDAETSALWKECRNLFRGENPVVLKEIKERLESRKYELSEQTDREEILKAALSAAAERANLPSKTAEIMTDFSEDGYALIYCLLNRQMNPEKKAPTEDEIKRVALMQEFSALASQELREECLIQKLLKIISEEKRTKEDASRLEAAKVLIRAIDYDNYTVSTENTLWQVFPKEASQLLKGAVHDQ